MGPKGRDESESFGLLPNEEIPLLASASCGVAGANIKEVEDFDLQFNGQCFKLCNMIFQMAKIHQIEMFGCVKRTLTF